MKVEKVRIYGLEESIIASGYPMCVDTDKSTKSEERSIKLGSAQTGSGHDNFLSGIVVQFDLTMSQSMAQQFKRYHFVQCVSSQSTMHRICKLNIDEQCNEYVSPVTISMLKHLVDMYNNYESYSSDEIVIRTFELYGVGAKSKEDLFFMIVYNIPSGLELTARWSTNYLQLKTMFKQRHCHKLKEWREFCQWILTLPMMKDFLKIDKKSNL